MKRVLLPFLFLFALGLMILIAYLPAPVRPLDFQVIYHADMGLMRGLVAQQKAAGSFLVDTNNLVDPRRSTGGGSHKKRLDWKGTKKPAKKNKLKRERPPWRR